MSSRTPKHVLQEETIINAPPRPIFMLLTNLDLRAWIDHGVGWRVEKVEIVGEKKKGEGVVTRWRGETGETTWERDFTITEWRENDTIVFESDTRDLIIRHVLSPGEANQTLLTVTKEYYGVLEDEAGERERLATLVDNVRALMSRKK